MVPSDVAPVRHRRAGGMDLKSFKGTLEQDGPPADLTPALQAMWHQAKGDWHRAHELAQSQDDAIGAWVHAHLHRVEGDASNAGYWYRRAGKDHATQSLDKEWDEIVSALL